jgi:hypothetical protein
MKPQIILEKRTTPKCGCGLFNWIELGKRNLELLNFIKSNAKKNKRELAKEVINHVNFMYKGTYEYNNALRLIKAALNTNNESAYELRDTNGGVRNGLWIMHFDFTLIYVR